MPPDPDLPEYLDDMHQRIAEFASEFLEEDEREDFVDGLLERHGYTRQSIWAPPEPAQGGGRKPLVKPRTGQGQGQGQKRGSYFGGGQARK
jgi:hypothetical protein